MVFAPFRTENGNRLKTGIDFADSGLESGVVVIVFEGTTGVYERIHCSNFNG